MQAQHIEDSFDWAVTVLQSDQANAFCLPGGKMAVYTGLVPVAQNADAMAIVMRSEEHTSELQSLMRISYAVFCLKKKKTTKQSRRKHKTYSYHKQCNDT